MNKRSLKNLTIPQYLSLGFLLVILTGATLLSLPIASKSGQATPFIDALFTAVSATCVTGQVIYNTVEHWSHFGQIVIITMIEIGGLGVMTILVLLTLFLGKKLQLKDRLLIHESLNLKESNDASEIVKYVIKFSLSVQAIGALILSTQLIPQFGVLKGIYYSIFHAISAFCNAGFDLFGDSLMSYQNNPVIIMTIAGLIIFGGLGFIVWRDLFTYRKNKHLLLQTRLVLILTVILLVSGTVLYIITEYNTETFSGLSLGSMVMNSFFMSTTARTAGYANVNYATLSIATLFLTCILMFIGGASGSTAGGIKVTTIAVLFLYLRASIKGEHVVFKKRGITNEIVLKSITLLVISLLLIVVSTFILSITEVIPPGFGIEYILVEVFSCFGTVGLTMGLTPNLSVVGKLLLSLLMFMGRVGLLTVIMSFSHQRKTDGIRYPNGHIMIG